MMKPDKVTNAITKELDRAYSKHGRDPWSRHEFYGILKEEVDELWDVIKSDASEQALTMEAIQVAAMVFRYLETRVDPHQTHDDAHQLAWRNRIPDQPGWWWWLSGPGESAHLLRVYNESSELGEPNLTAITPFGRMAFDAILERYPKCRWAGPQQEPTDSGRPVNS